MEEMRKLENDELGGYSMSGIFGNGCLKKDVERGQEIAHEHYSAS